MVSARPRSEAAVHFVSPSSAFAGATACSSTGRSCERLLGSVHRECLDHMLIVSEAHLRRILKEYVTYFNRARPHQGIGQQVPEPTHIPDGATGTTGNIISFPVLGGLHHEYRRAA